MGNADLMKKFRELAEAEMRRKENAKRDLQGRVDKSEQALVESESWMHSMTQLLEELRVENAALHTRMSSPFSRSPKAPRDRPANLRGPPGWASSLAHQLEGDGAGSRAVRSPNGVPSGSPYGSPPFG